MGWNHHLETRPHCIRILNIPAINHIDVCGKEELFHSGDQYHIKCWRLPSFVDIIKYWWKHRWWIVTDFDLAGGHFENGTEKWCQQKVFFGFKYFKCNATGFRKTSTTGNVYYIYNTVGWFRRFIWGKFSTMIWCRSIGPEKQPHLWVQNILKRNQISIYKVIHCCATTFLLFSFTIFLWKTTKCI